MNLLPIIAGFIFAGSLFYFLTYFMDSFSEKQKLQDRINGLMLKKRIKIARGYGLNKLFPFQQILQRQNFIQKLQELLSVCGWTMPIGVFIIIDCLVAAISFILSLLITGSFLVAPLATIIGFFLPYGVLHISRQRYRESFTRQFPDTLMMMRNALTAGQGVQAAIKLIGAEGPKPVAGEFARIIQKVDLGSQLSEALGSLYDRIQTADVKIFVMGLYIHEEIGGNIAELFEHIEKTIRDRRSLFQEARVLTSQGRFSGLVLMGLPLGFAVLISIISPGYMLPLFQTEMGRKILIFATISWVLGSVCIRKITHVSIVN